MFGRVAQEVGLAGEAEHGRNDGMVSSSASINLGMMPTLGRQRLSEGASLTLPSTFMYNQRRRSPYRRRGQHRYAATSTVNRFVASVVLPGSFRTLGITDLVGEMNPCLYTEEPEDIW